MAEIPLYVVDASTALKWSFQEEIASQQALDLLIHYRRGKIALIGPHQLAYEYSSVVRRRVLDGRLSATAGQEAIMDLLALRLPLAYPDGLLRVAYDYSFRYALRFMTRTTLRWPRSNSASL